MAVSEGGAGSWGFARLRACLLAYLLAYDVSNLACFELPAKHSFQCFVQRQRQRPLSCTPRFACRAVCLPGDQLFTVELLINHPHLLAALTSCPSCAGGGRDTGVPDALPKVLSFEKDALGEILCMDDNGSGESSQAAGDRTPTGGGTNDQSGGSGNTAPITSAATAVASSGKNSTSGVQQDRLQPMAGGGSVRSSWLTESSGSFSLDRRGSLSSLEASVSDGEEDGGHSDGGGRVSPGESFLSMAASVRDGSMMGLCRGGVLF